MIGGVVTSGYEPVVRCRVRSPGGSIAFDVELVVDTGITGMLTLPAAMVANLNLPWCSSGTMVLADGFEHPTDYYEVELEWASGWVYLLASTVGPEGMVGMQMLDGCRLTVEGSPGGSVEIVPWP